MNATYPLNKRKMKNDKVTSPKKEKVATFSFLGDVTLY